MSRKKRELSSEEKTLWRRVAATMKPRRPVAVEEDDAPSPVTAARVTPAKKIKPPPIEASPPARRPRPAPPADRGAEKRVRRGKLEIGASLDLHGHTQESGRAALLRFLHAAYRRGDRTVIVVTGKGRAGEGVLKRAFPEWLAAAELKPILSGFAQAHRDHGGAGAFYVFLKA